jgi:hypothetical protein
MGQQVAQLHDRYMMMMVMVVMMMICEANVFTKAELDRESGKGDVVTVTVKYLQQVACVDIEGRVKRR